MSLVPPIITHGDARCGEQTHGAEKRGSAPARAPRHPRRACCIDKQSPGSRASRSEGHHRSLQREHVIVASPCRNRRSRASSRLGDAWCGEQIHTARRNGDPLPLGTPAIHGGRAKSCAPSATGGVQARASDGLQFTMYDVLRGWKGPFVAGEAAGNDGEATRRRPAQRVDIGHHARAHDLRHFTPTADSVTPRARPRRAARHHCPWARRDCPGGLRISASEPPAATAQGATRATRPLRSVHQEPPLSSLAGLGGSASLTLGDGGPSLMVSSLPSGP